MSRVSTYLNFPRSTEKAFVFYRSVFGGDFVGPIHRFGEVPAAPGQPPLAEADRNLVMHVELPILAHPVKSDAWPIGQRGPAGILPTQDSRPADERRER